MENIQGGEVVQGVRVRGMLRVQILDEKTGQIQGDSGWVDNAIMNTGFDQFLVNRLHTSLTGQTISHGAIGSSTAAPNATNTSLAGEFETRKTTAGSLSSVGTLLNTWSYATNEATQSQVARIGLFNSSSGGSMFSEATFAASTKTTAQTLAVSYQISFS